MYNRGIQASGVQLIKPSHNKSSLSVYCVMQKPQEIEGDNSEDGIEAGRGWTVIQQRTTGIQIKKLCKQRNVLGCCYAAFFDLFPRGQLNLTFNRAC